jgi:hypothetical protein
LDSGMLALTIRSAWKQLFSKSDILRLTIADRLRKEAVRVPIQVGRFAQRL